MKTEGEQRRTERGRRRESEREREGGGRGTLPLTHAGKKIYEWVTSLELLQV